MGLFSSSWERQVDNNLFDFIDVDQFKNTKFTTVWNYLFMIAVLLLSIVFYCVDIYTCIKLLAFDEWSSQVKPYLSFKISKWLFAACIICSIVLLIYESVRGFRVLRTKNISLIYTNTFAKNAKSLQSYKCFCVLNEINPSSGFDKMAFYTYFTFHGSKKLLLADSPRQVINALTLYSVFNVRYGFLETIKKISVDSRNEAIILYTMTVSFAIWLFFIFQFFFALVFAIPVFYRVLHVLKFKALRQYVCVKVDHTVKKLARHYQKKSLQKITLENQQRYKPTLPDIDPLKFTPSSLPKKPETFTSIRTNSSTTLRTVSENPFDDKQNQLYEMTNFKNAVAKPLLAHHHDNPSVHSLPRHYESSNSLTSKPQPLPYQYNNSTHSLLQSRPADINYSNDSLSYKGAIPFSQGRNYSGSSNEGSVLEYPKRTVFANDYEVSETQPTHYSESDLSEDDDKQEFNDNDSLASCNFTDGNNRKPIRQSLLRRAHEMDSEDYTRFNPSNNRSTDALQNQRSNSNNSEVPVFQRFQGRKVLK
ncbi:unnamed protein product [Wickerhamomyces anomalus]